MLAITACSGSDVSVGAPATTVIVTTIPATTATTVVATAAASVTTAVSTVTTTAVTTAAPASGIDLHSVDWRTALATQPALHAVDEPAPFDRLGPYYEHRAGLAGYVAVDPDQINYADLTGDGRDEALLAVDSGGTAGTNGVLVFSGGPSGPVLIGPDSFYGSFGYKTSFQARDRQLVIGNVTGAGWEANCCWSGIQQRTFRVVGGQFVEQGTMTESGIKDARAGTVERYYDFINDGDLDTAYTFLAPTVQAKEPLATWKAGFATTESVTATADALATSAPDVVTVRLDAVDRNADGTTRASCFTGTWGVAYDPGRHQWLLGDPHIAPC